MVKKNPLKMIGQFANKVAMSIIKFILILFREFNHLLELPFKLNNKVKDIFSRSSYSIIKQSLTALIICAFGDLCAGLILGNMTVFLETWPGLITIVPGAIGMRGNIFGSFGSRLGTNLNLGIISPKFERNEVLNQNIISSFILTLLLSIFLGFITKFICLLSGSASMPLADFIIISFMAGLISSLIMFPISMVISLKSFEHGWDPDNITTPLIAAFGDFFTLPSILLSVLILSLFNDFVLIRNLVAVFFVVFVVFVCYYGVKSDDGVLKIVKESSPVLLFCSILGGFSGGVLDNFSNTLISKEGLLTLVPLFSGESGNLVSILGARLSSSIHAGVIEAKFKLNKFVVNNFLAIFFLSVVIYPLIAVLVGVSTFLLGGVSVSFVALILISLIAGLLMIFILQFIVLYISTLSYKYGLDPDNIVIPLSTSITDSIATLLLVYIC